VNGWINPRVRRDAAFTGAFDADEHARVRQFYGAHPELQPTPLRSLPGFARALGAGEILIKDESARFDVEAFKIAGVRYAMDRLGAAVVSQGVACATAGNHGRAVAHVARELGVPCTVFVPAARSDIDPGELAVRSSRVATMRADGAAVIDVDGSYEAAVADAARHAESSGATVISDTAWPGYDTIPRWIMAGYMRLFDEAAAAWTRAPGLVLVQGGVGGLVCAAASWIALTFGGRGDRPCLIACEPDSSACLLESARAGTMVNLDARGEREARTPTIMAGLRCAEPSPAAWPAIAEGVDAFVSIPDALAREAMHRLASPEPGDPRVLAGPSGACSTGALIALSRAHELAAIREHVRFGQSTSVLAVVTEGP
jgi:diaminopropionate ammonia-lyase